MLATLSVACVGLSFSWAGIVPQERMEARREFSELKFGIFVHWGLYASFAQGEWYLEQGGLDAVRGVCYYFGQRHETVMQSRF